MAELLEDGDIYFLYRPRVEEEHVDSLEEVQRLLVVMHPWHGRHLRLLVVGRKRLPEIEEHDRFWAFVDVVVDRPQQLHGALQAREYRTKTRDRREQPPARPAAEGAYVIARHDDHTHLAHELELPPHPGEGAARARHRTGGELYRHGEARCRESSTIVASPRSTRPTFSTTPGPR